MSRSCPICFCAEKNHLYTQNFGNKTIPLMEKYNVKVCKQCGFAFADNIPSQEEFNKYYESMSKWEFNYNEGMVSDNYKNYFKKIVNFLVPHLSNKNVRIMDIGCSTGCLLSKLKERGYTNLLGIDPSLQ